MNKMRRETAVLHAGGFVARRQPRGRSTPSRGSRCRHGEAAVPSVPLLLRRSLHAAEPRCPDCFRLAGDRG